MRLNPEVFTLGLDYPARTWRRFEHQPFERLASFASRAGLTAIRLELPWAEFQPDGGRCSDSCLRDLEAVMNTCGVLRIGLLPALFSPLDVNAAFPAWTSQASEIVIEAQLRLLETLSGYFRAHRALIAWELDLRGAPTPAVASAWQSDLLPALRRWDERHRIALGLDHESLYEADGSFILSLVASADLAVLRLSNGLGNAGQAAADLWNLAQKPLIVVAEKASIFSALTADQLSALPLAGVTGVFVPVPESAGDTVAEVWENLRQAADSGWHVRMPAPPRREPEAS